MNRITKIIIMVVICLTVGYLSGKVTRDNLDTWYVFLKKPSFNPPSWVFAPVWITLYIMMGSAAGIVWSFIDTQKDKVRKGLFYFLINLALNALWSFIFFGLKSPLLALIEIVFLWFFIYKTFLQFLNVSKSAGYLLIPYLLWVTYAFILNTTIWWLNIGK